MKNAGVILHVLFHVVFGDLSVKKQQQPDVTAMESMSSEPIWEFDGQNGDAIENNPPIRDFLALQQRNAELALQVKEMTSELHKLQNVKKTTKWHTKLAVQKLQQHCSALGESEEEMVAQKAEVREGVAMMPWSLTHTATRHKMQSQFPGDGIFKDITSYFREGSTAVQAVSSYLRKIPVLGQAKEVEKKQDEELKTIHSALKDARVRLGRNKEARRGLEDHLNALTGRIAQAKIQADAENAALEQAVKAEQDLDKKIMKMKAQFDQSQAPKPDEAIKIELARSEEVQNVSTSLHAEVQKRMNDTAKVLETLKFQNQQIERAIDESKARLPDKLLQLQNLKQNMQNATAQLGNLHSQKEHLMHEEADEETRVANEDQQLMATSGQLESCDDWSKKLEKKVNKVIDGNKDDAKLCHKSILGLHGERVKLKQELHKQYTELKKQKETAASLEHKGDETSDMLNHCLGRLK